MGQCDRSEGREACWWMGRIGNAPALDVGVDRGGRGLDRLDALVLLEHERGHVLHHLRELRDRLLDPARRAQSAPEAHLAAGTARRGARTCAGPGSDFAPRRTRHGRPAAAIGRAGPGKFRAR